MKVYHYHITPEYTTSDSGKEQKNIKYLVVMMVLGEVHSGTATQTDYIGSYVQLRFCKQIR